MDVIKLCVIIVSSLVLYVVVLGLVKSNSIQLKQVNLLRARFYQDVSITKSNEFTHQNNGLRLGIKESVRTHLNVTQGPTQIAHDPNTSSKYTTSLSPDYYTLTREAEIPKSKPADLDKKSITQLDTEASTANQLGVAVKRFPTTLIIGVRKAGTRALLSILGLHPQIKSCGPEVHFFDQRYLYGLRWYLDQTPKVKINQQTIEKTPSYFVVRNVPQRILKYSKKINKTLKFLVIVRDPTVRAVSDYLQLSIGVKEKFHTILKPFEKLVMSNRSVMKINTSWGVIKTGVYSKHLQRWLRYFPQDWFHFVSGEELVKNPYDEIKKVEKFLGITPYFRQSNFVFNPKKGFPCFRALSQKNERCLGKAKGRTHPPVNSSVLSKLRKYYRPFNEELYKMVGRDFHWP